MNRLNTLSRVIRVVTTDYLKESKLKNRHFLIKTVNSKLLCSLPSQQNINPVEEEALKPNTSVEQIENETLTLAECGAPLQPTYTFAAYADKAVILQKFIDLGVELYKWEKDLSIVKFIVQLNFEKHVEPVLMFLHQHGVIAEDFGKIITKYPLLFKEDLDDMETRINYLKSKNFTTEMITRIITKHPKWLSVPVVDIDKRLGYLQQTYKLSGNNIRKIITETPTLGTVPLKRLMINFHMLKEEMNLDEYEMKKLVLTWPTLLKKDEYDILQTYEYLTKVMKVPVHLVLQQPVVLTYKVYKIKERHKYLSKLGRAQYNPLLPGYVYLTDIVKMTDEEFCKNIARTSTLTYNEYLKTQ